jgi:hypothetical protein
VAESCHLTVWNPRLLHLRARGLPHLHFRIFGPHSQRTVRLKML